MLTNTYISYYTKVQSIIHTIKQWINRFMQIFIYTDIGIYILSKLTKTTSHNETYVYFTIDT